MTAGVSQRIVAALAWSVIVWAALWRDLSVANVLGGLAVGAVTIALVPVHESVSPPRVRPLGVLALAAYFVGELVKASAVVAWEVVTPANKLHQAVVAVPLRTDQPSVVTIVANMITLTPGTVTLEVERDPPTLYVHILHLRTPDDVRRDIQRLESFALSAFPPRSDGPPVSPADES